MNSLLQLNGMSPLDCESDEQIKHLSPSILRLLKRNGYCIVNMWDTSEPALSLISRQLGRMQLHIRSNPKGLVSVSPKPLTSCKQIDSSKYRSVKTCEHPPHTDGAYLDGFLKKNGESQWIGPPALVLLQCVQPAAEGGQSIVIDAQRILEDMLRKTPEVAQLLATPGCVSFCRDDQVAFRTAIYESISMGRFRIRFRCDDALYLSSTETREAVQYFCEHYLTNPQYRVTFSLAPGQILILDNLRVLHGRQKFSDSGLGSRRFLRRTWVADNTLPSAPICFESTDDYACRVFERFEPYSAAQQPIKLNQKTLSLGIHLPGNLQAVLESRIPKPVPIAV